MISKFSSNYSICIQHVPAIPLPMNTHSMVTRSNAGKSKHRASVVENSESLPAIAREALLLPHWKATMRDEIDALLRTNTWSLVTNPSEKNIIGYEWVFRVKKQKKNPDGTFQRHKAKLLAKG